MKPQPRHIEAAGRVTLEWYKNHVPAVSPEIRTLLVLDIARALAEAENRAAWDVKQNQPDESTYEWLEAKYGPRPITENQP